MTSPHPIKAWPGWLICVLFMGFAVLQLNDPDPWAWTLLYGVVALLAALSALHRIAPRQLGIAAGVYTLLAVLYMIPALREIWTAWWVPHSMEAEAHAASMTSWGGEEGREVGGLWISACALAGLRTWHRRHLRDT